MMDVLGIEKAVIEALVSVLRLISEPKHTTTQRMYLQARDIAALKEYLSWIG